MEHLPPESAFKTALRNQYTDEQLAAAADQSTGHGPWSRAEMLLAAVFDALQVLTHVQVSRAGVSSDPPTPLSRPGVVDAAKKPVSPQALAYLQRIRDQHAEQTETEAS